MKTYRLLLILAVACATPEAERELDGMDAPQGLAPPVATNTAPTDTAGEPIEGGLQSPPWQAAIARGVDFRGLGQEPGWSIDIDNEGEIVYAGDYGTDTLRAATPEPVREDDALTWSVRADGSELRARVVEASCEDTMSGERFTHTVTLFVDERELRGCGRWIGALPR